MLMWRQRRRPDDQLRLLDRAREPGSARVSGTRPREHRERFVSGPEACYEARRALDRFTDELGVALVKTLQLLVTELVANAVCHAGTGGRGLVDLEILITDERVRVTVSDRGGGFDPRPAPGDPVRDRNRGLQIVEGMTDRWGVLVNGKTRVWFEIDRAESSASDVATAST